MAPSLTRDNAAVKILCTGLNYLSHIRETGREPPAEPLLFGKFENTLIGPGEAIVLPPEATHVDSEAELAVEIGRPGRQITEDDALDFVAGYRCANDVSARNLQYGDKQWTRGKGFDTFCPVGDRLVPVSELGDASGVRVVQRLNGELFPDGSRCDVPATSRIASSAKPTSVSSKRIGSMLQMRSHDTSTFSCCAARPAASFAASSICASLPAARFRWSRRHSAVSTTDVTI